MPRGKTFDNAAAAIGDTPMIRVNRLVTSDQATVFAKCEFFQPLNSVKDRIGVAMIDAGDGYYSIQLSVRGEAEILDRIDVASFFKSLLLLPLG